LSGGLKGNLIITVGHIAPTIVVGILLATILLATILLATILLATTNSIAAAAIGVATTKTVTGTVTAATKEAYVVRHNLCVVAVLPFPVLPLACLNAALDKELLSLLAELADVLGLSPEDNDRVPLGMVGPVSLSILTSI
jgi:hypothetical protein